MSRSFHGVRLKSKLNSYSTLVRSLSCGTKGPSLLEIALLCDMLLSLGFFAVGRVPMRTQLFHAWRRWRRWWCPCWAPR
jgi:hypothetical protein